MNTNVEINTVNKIGLQLRSWLNSDWGRPLLGQAAALMSIRTRKGYTPVRYENGMWIHDCPDGFVVDRIVNFRETVSRQIAATKEQWFHQYVPQEGDVMVDIGAGIATETAAMSRSAGNSGRVFAIEANPKTYECLVKFCALNQLDNVVTLPYAVSNKSGYVMIDDESLHIASSIVTDGGSVKVEAQTIDQLMAEHNVNKVAFIKMNIEGAERYAIEGMTETIKRTQYVCFSCHDFRADHPQSGGTEMMRTKALVREFLEDNQFEITERLDDPRAWVQDQLYGRNMQL